MASKNLLTEQDKIAYSVISKFIKENGYPPSVRELCKIMGKSSTATIKYRLKSLEQKGFIKTTSGAKRTIRLLNGVVHGRWIIDKEHLIATCSECGKILRFSDEMQIAFLHDEERFCYYCGADMRGDGNG